jgi:hypothetical protein
MKNVNLFFFCLLVANAAFAQNHRIYVNSVASGANTGQSWTNAYINLQSACQSALAGDSIWIAEGIYYPDSSGNQTTSFEPKSGIKIFGGFSGSETDISQRNWLVHQTVLSGDIGIVGDSLDNSYNVMYLFEPDSNTVLDGLIFRDGVANYESGANTASSRLICGGGLYIMANGATAYPDIRNCKFIHNTALYFGGGALVNGENGGSVAPRFINCIFDSNRAGFDGGGLGKLGASQVERGVDLDSCVFTNNHAGLRGGGWYYDDSNGKDTIDIINSLFEGNHAGTAGGGAFFFLGRNGKSHIKVKKTDFNANSSVQGAALDLFTNFDTFDGKIEIDSCNFKYSSSIGSVFHADLLSTLQSEIKIRRTHFEQNKGDILRLDFAGVAKIENTIFKNNVCQLVMTLGGLIETNINNAIFSGNSQDYTALHGNNLKVKYQNCVFNNNISTGPNSFDFTNTDSLIFKNCTVYNSFTNTLMGDGPKNVFLYNCFMDLTTHGQYLNSPGSKIHLANCHLNGFNCANQPSNITCDSNITTSGDPLFIDPINGNFRLQPCSPLVNAGSNTFIDAFDSTDIANTPRIQGGRVDIGAYETPAPNLITNPNVSPACHGVANGAASIQVTNGCEPYQTAWSSGSTSGQNLTALQAGLYILTITDARGSSFTASLTIPEGSNLSLVPQSSPVICGDSIGGSATAQVKGGPAPFSFNWQSSTDSVFINLAPGDYPLTVTDALGCTAIGTVSVTKTGNLDIDVQVTPISCFGASDGSFTITPQNGKSPYQWNWENGPSSPAYGPLGPGTYNGTLTDAFGCNIIWVLPLTQPDSLYFEAIITPASDSMPGNGSIQLNPIIGGTQPYSALWSNGQTFLSLHNLKPGTYSVTLTDHNGCAKTATYSVPFTVGTIDAGAPPPISIFPNPADQVIHIRSEKLVNSISFNVCNALGQLVLQGQASASNLDINVKGWPTGLYTLSILTGEKRILVSKIVVQH